MGSEDLISNLCLVIDDKLPYNPVDGSLMCMTILPDNSSSLATNQPQWPSLLEKAVGAESLPKSGANSGDST